MTHLARVSYGQTGSGKTFFMTRAVASAVSVLGGDVKDLSCFELRGDTVQDLLNNRESLRVLCDEGGRDVVCGLSLHGTKEGEGVTDLIEKAARLRKTAPTRANPQSSRSHCFTTLHLMSGENNATSTLTFVDLAGSESKEDLLGHCELAEDTAAAEERIKEMKEINSSLGDLKECIRLNLVKAAAPKGKPLHVPYRRSTLTRLLRPALDPEISGSSNSHRTTFIAHVAPGGAEQLKGTANTLNYAEFMVRASRADEERKKVRLQVAELLEHRLDTR